VSVLVADGFPHGEGDVLDAVARFGAPGRAEDRERGRRRVDTDHAFEVGNRDEQRPVGVALAQQRVDLEHRMRRIVAVDASAVVDDSLEDRQRSQSHATMSTNGSRTLAASEELMDEGARALVDGVERLGAAWVVNAVMRIIDAYGRVTEPARVRALADARAAGERAATRVASELRSLFALDPAAQRATPLEIIRSLRAEATEVLADAGVPEVVRDDYDMRAFPDDIYGIVPKYATDLGEEDLGGALLAWGMGKARVLRERADPGQGVES
jgi:hypothetical protein